MSELEQLKERVIDLERHLSLIKYLNEHLFDLENRVYKLENSDHDERITDLENINAEKRLIALEQKLTSSKSTPLKTEDLTFMEAIKAMQEGKKVRREKWDEQIYTDISKNPAWNCIFSWRDVTATDWEIFSDKECSHVWKPLLNISFPPQKRCSKCNIVKWDVVECGTN